MFEIKNNSRIGWKGKTYNFRYRLKHKIISQLRDRYAV